MKQYMLTKFKRTAKSCILTKPTCYPNKDLKLGYWDDNEVGQFILALSGIDATICATLDTAGFSCSFVKPLDLEGLPNSLANWSTPLFSSKHNTSNLS